MGFVTCMHSVGNAKESGLNIKPEFAFSNLKTDISLDNSFTLTVPGSASYSSNGLAITITCIGTDGVCFTISKQADGIYHLTVPSLGIDLELLSGTINGVPAEHFVPDPSNNTFILQ